MDIDGELVMENFLEGMGSFFILLGYGSVAGMCFGVIFIYMFHYLGTGTGED